MPHGVNMPPKNTSLGPSVPVIPPRSGIDVPRWRNCRVGSGPKEKGGEREEKKNPDPDCTRESISRRETNNSKPLSDVERGPPRVTNVSYQCRMSQDARQRDSSLQKNKKGRRAFKFKERLTRLTKQTSWQFTVNTHARARTFLNIQAFSGHFLSLVIILTYIHTHIHNPDFMWGKKKKKALRDKSAQIGANTSAAVTQ